MDAFQRLIAELTAPDPENVLRAWQACNERDLQVNLTLVMGGFEFEAVWNERRTFMVDSTEIPVARLSHIVQSKAAAGREKDRLFLATHADTLKQLLGRGD